jgi:hypothetical protein
MRAERLFTPITSFLQQSQRQCTTLLKTTEEIGRQVRLFMAAGVAVLLAYSQVMYQ